MPSALSPVGEDVQAAIILAAGLGREYLEIAQAGLQALVKGSGEAFRKK